MYLFIIIMNTVQYRVFLLGSFSVMMGHIRVERKQCTNWFFQEVLSIHERGFLPEGISDEHRTICAINVRMI